MSAPASTKTSAGAMVGTRLPKQKLLIGAASSGRLANGVHASLCSCSRLRPNRTLAQQKFRNRVAGKRPQYLAIASSRLRKFLPFETARCSPCHIVQFLVISPKLQFRIGAVFEPEQLVDHEFTFATFDLHLPQRSCHNSLCVPKT